MNVVASFVTVGLLLPLFLSTTLADGSWVDPDANRDFCGVVKDKEYPCELHHVTTSDGYILSVHRVPYGKGQTPTSKRPVALLMHGLIDDSFTWIVNMPNQSLAYAMADAGYDVWMGNVRGNRFSRNHTTIKPSQSRFWAFTWQHHAQIDLPNTVDYVLAQTSQEKLFYVGHSQGTTIAFASFSSSPKLASKIIAFGALAPVVFVGHQTNELLIAMSKIMDPFKWLKLLGVREFMGPSMLPWPLDEVAKLICYARPRVCQTVVELWVGRVIAPQNASRLPVIVAHEPGGTSVMNMMHWQQLYHSNKFQMYDYGSPSENVKHYGQPKAPYYNISAFPTTLPTIFFTGTNDELADPVDVNDLIAIFPIKPLPVVSVKDYGHLDFLWAIDAITHVYQPLLQFFSKFSDM